MAKQIYR